MQLEIYHIQVIRWSGWAFVRLLAVKPIHIFFKANLDFNPPTYPACESSKEERYGVMDFIAGTDKDISIIVVDTIPG